MNDIDQYYEKDCHLIQNADHTIRITEHEELREATEKNQRNPENLQIYFHQKEIMMYDKKQTFLFIFANQKQNKSTKRTITMHNETKRPLNTGFFPWYQTNQAEARFEPHTNVLIVTEIVKYLK